MYNFKMTSVRIKRHHFFKCMFSMLFSIIYLSCRCWIANLVTTVRIIIIIIIISSIITYYLQLRSRRFVELVF